jgi:hypothetical protein
VCPKSQKPARNSTKKRIAGVAIAALVLLQIAEIFWHCVPTIERQNLHSVERFSETMLKVLKSLFSDVANPAYLKRQVENL